MLHIAQKWMVSVDWEENFKEKLSSGKLDD